MKTLDSLTRDQVNLLLYFETRAVDYSGRVKDENLNADDLVIARCWNEEGFVSFGRVASDYLNHGSGNHWCNLSEEAWELAAAARKARAARNWSRRNWMSTAEKREAARV